MTARAKGRRQKNAKIKRDKNKIKELQRLRKKVGMMDTDGLFDQNQVNVVEYEKKVNRLPRALFSIANVALICFFSAKRCKKT